MQAAISENLSKVLSATSESARQAGRSADSVSLIAVSKTHPVEVIQEAVDAGMAMRIDLTPEQARRVRDLMEWNEQPENRFYRYDYYRDNCSTRVRDVIDRVLGGALKSATANAPSGVTYRWHTRRLVAEGASSIPMYTVLEGGLGPAADRPISKWDEMFLPMRLRDEVLTVVLTLDNLVKGAAGQAIQNANLVLGLDEGAGLTALGLGV